MLKDSIAILAANPPPPQNHDNRPESVKLNEQIAALETQLGIPHGAKIFNILQARRRINHLEGLVSQKESAAKAAKAAVAPVAPSVVQPPALETSTRKLEIVAGEFFAGDVMRLAALPENEKRNSLAVLFWKNRVTYPGCESDFARIDATKNQRNISDAHFAGMNRIRVSIQQELITAKLKKIK